MFKVSFHVDDKGLGEALKLLAEIASDTEYTYVEDAKPNGEGSTLSTTPLRARPGSKMIKVEMLLRKGATGGELKRATGWPFNIPGYAKTLGYELHTKKVKRNGRQVKLYWVTVK